MNRNWCPELIEEIDETIHQGHVRYESNRQELKRIRRLLAVCKFEEARTLLKLMRNDPQGDSDCRKESIRLSGFLNRIPPLDWTEAFWEVIAGRDASPGMRRIYGVMLIMLAVALLVMLIGMWFDC